MIYRDLGSTGQKISAIGIGGWQTSVVITGIDSIKILDQAFEAINTFRPMSDADLQPLLARTAAAASTGKFEPFKTSSIFDSTATHPDWLGEEAEHVQKLIPGS